MQPLVKKGKGGFFLLKCMEQNDWLRYIIELCAKKVQLSRVCSVVSYCEEDSVFLHLCLRESENVCLLHAMILLDCLK